jgi:hypothetical protein
MHKPENLVQISRVIACLKQQDQMPKITVITIVGLIYSRTKRGMQLKFKLAPQTDGVGSEMEDLSQVFKDDSKC